MKKLEELLEADIVLSETSFKLVVELVNAPPAPSQQLRELLQRKYDKNNK